MSSLKQLPTKKFTSQHGFSLLELVLVMFIIGLIASTPLMFIDNQENQLRYEETVQKMELISRALYQRESYRNQPILSGFIIDNGVLPPDQDYESSPHNIGISPLINKVDDYDTNDETWLDYSDWLPLESRRPYYNLGGTSDQLTNGFAQLKGFRGRYIHQGLDSNNDFKDSWGNDFIIDVSSSIGSYGYDASNAYRSISQQLTGNQWQIPLSSIDINIINNTSSTITNTPVVLLVFTNKQDASDSGKESDAWLTYHLMLQLLQELNNHPLEFHGIKKERP